MKIANYLNLLFAFTERELKSRYKNTVMGFLWMIVNPIIQMLVIGFIFAFFIKQPIKYYYYHLFIGLLVWNFFSLSWGKATPSIIYERNLIKKAKFPSSVIPLSIILSNYVHFMIGIILYFIPVLFLNTFSLYQIPRLIFALIFLLIFTIGICLFTSALNVRFRDFAFLVQAVLIVWFYATPIIYSLEFIPKNILWLWRLNPLTSVMQLLQHVFLKEWQPGIGMLISNSFVTIIIFVLGLWAFRHESRNFDDWL